MRGIEPLVKCKLEVKKAVLVEGATSDASSHISRSTTVKLLRLLKYVRNFFIIGGTKTQSGSITNASGGVL